jgi:hypothetical protein
MWDFLTFANLANVFVPLGFALMMLLADSVVYIYSEVHNLQTGYAVMVLDMCFC